MLSLVADYSSDSEDENNDEQTCAQLPEPVEKLKLPSANVLFENSSNGKPGDVFSNPYKQAEQAKIALLERHVKMVNSDEHIKTKNGKKICWNYRKGRCRFGSNCSFAHDSDLNEISPFIKNNTDVIRNEDKQDKSLQHQYGSSQLTIDERRISQIDESSSTIFTNAKKRNRFGLSESIVPNKRVLKAYAHQKQTSFSSNTKLT